MKKLILLLLFIPLVSFGQDDSVSSNIEKTFYYEEGVIKEKAAKAELIKYCNLDVFPKPDVFPSFPNDKEIIRKISSMSYYKDLIGLDLAIVITNSLIK